MAAHGSPSIVCLQPYPVWVTDGPGNGGIENTFRWDLSQHGPPSTQPFLNKSTVVAIKILLWPRKLHKILTSITYHSGIFLFSLVSKCTLFYHVYTYSSNSFFNRKRHAMKLDGTSLHIVKKFQIQYIYNEENIYIFFEGSVNAIADLKGNSPQLLQ